MQVASLFRENVAAIGTATLTNEKVSRNIVTETLANSTSDKMSSNDADECAAIASSSGTIFSEERKRKYINDVECTRTTRQQQKERERNVLKKMREEHIMKQSPRSKKYLRSTAESLNCAADDYAVIDQPVDEEEVEVLTAAYSNSSNDTDDSRSSNSVGGSSVEVDDAEHTHCERYFAADMRKTVTGNEDPLKCKQRIVTSDATPEEQHAMIAILGDAASDYDNNFDDAIAPDAKVVTVESNIDAATDATVAANAENISTETIAMDSKSTLNIDITPDSALKSPNVYYAPEDDIEDDTLTSEDEINEDERRKKEDHISTTTTQQHTEHIDRPRLTFNCTAPEQSITLNDTTDLFNAAIVSGHESSHIVHKNHSENESIYGGDESKTIVAQTAISDEKESKTLTDNLSEHESTTGERNAITESRGLMHTTEECTAYECASSVNPAPKHNDADAALNFRNVENVQLEKQQHHAEITIQSPAVTVTHAAHWTPYKMDVVENLTVAQSSDLELHHHISDNYRKIKQHHSMSDEEQQRQENQILENSLHYDSYLEHNDNNEKHNMQSHNKLVAETASTRAPLNTDVQHEQNMYNIRRQMREQPHEDKNNIALRDSISVFSNMPHLQNNYIQQPPHQQHSHYEQNMLLQAEQQHQGKLEPQTSHFQHHQQHMASQFTHEQLFHFQQQQQHNLHHVMHNQLNNQIQLQQQQQTRSQSLPNQRQHDERATLMSYLHQEQHHRQQNMFHQEQQEQYQQQRMQQETLLMSSPQVHHHQQQLKTQQQQMNKIHAPTRNNKLSQMPIEELIIDEYQEDHNVEFKLGLSPNNVKHENQDDGYETSAGDVLTPNSHTSTHSLTPQHQMQHPIGLLPPIKCDEQQLKAHQVQIADVDAAIQSQQQQLLQQPAHNMPMNSVLNQDILAENNSSAAADAYSFIDDELTAAANLRMMSPPNETRQSSTDRQYMGLSDSVSQITAPTLLDDKVLAAQQQQRQQLQTITTGHLQQSQDFGSRNYEIENFNSTVSEKDPNLLGKPPQKRRGRKKKIITAENITNSLNGGEAQDLSSSKEIDSCPMTSVVLKPKERKKHDRFNGMSEEEVAKRILPDHLCDNLDIVIVGINPGLFAAYKGHHYAGPGNHFWKCLYLSGLTHEQMSAEEDYKLMKYGIGFTNMVQRATKGSADLTRKETKDGSRILQEKLQRFRPKIAVFNGKLIFEVFSGKKDFNFGRQPECVDGTDTYIWVMPSSSARCAQLPRAADKVPFYAALKKFRDYLNGLTPNIDESECVFTDQKIKQNCDPESMELLSSGSGAEPNRVGMLYNNNGQLENVTTTATTQQEQHIDECLASNTNNNLLSKDTNIIQHQQHYNSNQQQHNSYLFSAPDNMYLTGMSVHTAGPGPPFNSGMTDDNRFMLPNCDAPPLEKKKRGRPKKLKNSIDLIDASKGNKIHAAVNQMQQSGSDFSNILNLSLMTGSVEIPKKKRGRPKKIKIPADMTQSQVQQRQQHQQQIGKCNPMSVQALMEHTTSPQQHAELFNTPSPTNVQQHHQPSIFAATSSASPMHSPVINCSYSTVTSPSTTQLTPPLHQKISNSTLDHSTESPEIRQETTSAVAEHSTYYNEKLRQTSDVSSAASSPHHSHIQQHMPPAESGTAANLTSVTGNTCESQMGGASPAPSASPNICSVDFEQPNATHNHLGNNIQQRQLLLHQRLQQQSARYASPTLESTSEILPPTHAGFHHWMSPNHQQQQQQHVTLEQNFNQQQPQQQQQLLHYEEHVYHLQQQQQQQQDQQHATLHWRHQQQRFDDNPAAYIIHHEQQQQHQESQQQHQRSSTHPLIPVSITDVTSKSLSGLESLVDQIPSTTESETAVNTSLSATAAAAVEKRLQSMQGGGNSGISQRNSSTVPLDSVTDIYGEHASNGTPNNNNDGSSGSNTPHTTNSMYGSGSPGNYSLQRLNSTASAASSPVSHASLRSPSYQQQAQQLIGQQHYSPSSATASLLDLLPPATPTALLNNSPRTPPLNNNEGSNVNRANNSSERMYGVGANSNNAIIVQQHVQYTNFSVSHLAASSATPPSPSTNTNYIPPSNHAYHHTNLITAAALAVVAAHSPGASNSSAAHTHHSAHSQIYMDPHAHLPVPVNTMYPHPHALAHVHAHHHHAHAYAPPTSAQHSPIAAVEYDGIPYGSPNAAAAAVQSTPQTSPTHTLHMPSPNYPYGYAAPPTQSSYSSHSMHPHQSTPPPPGAVSSATVAGYHHSHHHPHHHAPTHHLTMYDRLKPSDIGGYGSF